LKEPYLNQKKEYQYNKKEIKERITCLRCRGMNWVEGRVSIPLLITLLSNGSIATKGEGRDERGRKGREVQFSVYGV